VIQAGSWVGALVGELGCWNGDRPEVDTNGKKKKRHKEWCFGTVAESKSDGNWLVRWDRRGAASDEEHSTFKSKCEGLESDLRPTNQEAAQQRSATQQHQAQPQGVVAPDAAVQDATAAQQATRPPQQTKTTTMTPAQQPRQATVPLAETAVETVEETIARAAAEDANARTVDPDVLEEQDDRFVDVANDFELCNPDDVAEHDGDRHARKWTHHELAKAASIEDEVSVGAGARRIT
jgi:hypothetical protein